MKKECEGCLDSEEAYDYFYKHGEIPLHLPGNFEIWKEFVLKKDEHSEHYINERIELIKYLYCKLADSNKLRAYSRDMSLVRSGIVPPDVKDEAIRIVKEAEDLLDKTRDIDEYYLKGNHWMENQSILSDYITYLSAVYQVPASIMIAAPENKKWWRFW